MSYDYSVELPLAPHGKQSVRTGKGFAYTAPKTRRWMQDAAMLFAAGLPRSVLEPPYNVLIVAVVDRPQYMLKRYKDGRAKYGDGLLLAPAKPDCDNISKAVLDALDRHITDDKDVVDLRVLKLYREIVGLPRVIVRIRQETGDPTESANSALA